MSDTHIREIQANLTEVDQLLRERLPGAAGRYGRTAGRNRQQRGPVAAGG